MTLCYSSLNYTGKIQDFLVWRNIMSKLGHLHAFDKNHAQIKLKTSFVKKKLKLEFTLFVSNNKTK